MNGTKKKYWIFWTKWTFIFLKEGQFKLEFRKMDGYWIFFFGRLILSNDVVKLNKDWSNL